MFTGIGAVAEAFAARHNKPVNKKETSFYVCEICPATFNRRYNRDRHMEHVHKVPRPNLPPLYLEKSVPKNPAKNPDDGIIYTTPDPPINVLIDDKAIAMDTKRANSDTNPPQLRKIKKAKRAHPLDEDSEKPLVIDDDLPSPERPVQKDLDAEAPKAVEDKSCQTEENINMVQMPLNKEVAITILVTSK
ncbi:MAG: hypothetical protein GY696_37370 [Gammaproteobacteria bacterium]|nr:hypothetical protein [Gammaproteobacteria bacterium]